MHMYMYVHVHVYACASVFDAALVASSCISCVVFRRLLMGINSDPDSSNALEVDTVYDLTDVTTRSILDRICDCK